MLSAPEFHGVFPHVVSTVDEDGGVKRDVLTALLEHLIAAHVHGLTPLGSTGEFPYLGKRARPPRSPLHQRRAVEAGP